MSKDKAEKNARPEPGEFLVLDPKKDLGPHGLVPENCPTFYDACNCTVENLVGLQQDVNSLTVQLKAREKRVTELESDLRDYGAHHQGCSYPVDRCYGCKCGFLEVEEREQALTPDKEGGE